MVQRRQVQLTLSLMLRSPQKRPASAPYNDVRLRNGRLQKAGPTTTKSKSWAAGPIAKHENASRNQNERPHARQSQVKKIEDAKIVEKKKRADADEDDGAHGQVFAEIAQRIVDALAGAPGLGYAHRVEGHVEHEASQHESENDDCSNAEIIRIGGFHLAEQDRGEDYEVNESFIVFAVVNGAQAWEKAQDEGDSTGRSGGRNRRL